MDTERVKRIEVDFELLQSFFLCSALELNQASSNRQRVVPQTLGVNKQYFRVHYRGLS